MTQGRGSRSAALVALIATVWAVNLIWLSIDSRPPRWDESSYLTLGVRYLDDFAQHGPLELLRSMLGADPIRPPLPSAAAGAMFAIFGRKADVALYSYLLAYVVLVLSAYGIGSRTAGSGTGLLSGALVASYPSVAGLSRVFYQDFADAALVALAIYLLVRSDGFSHRKWSVAFGLACGAGLLTRAFFPVFVITPALLALGIHKRDAWKRVVNAGLGAVSILAVAGPWYLHNLRRVTNRSLSAAFGAQAAGYGPENSLAFSALLNFLKSFVVNHMGVLGAVLFGLALIGLTRAFESRWFLVSGLVVPYLFFTVLESQDIKNMTPVMIFVAVLTARGLLSLRWRSLLVSLALSVAISQLLAGAFGIPRLPGLAQATSNDLVPFPLKPKMGRWPLKSIVRRVSQADRRAKIAVVFDHPLINHENLRFTAARLGLAVEFVRVGDQRYMDKGLEETNFALVKTGFLAPAFANSNADAMAGFVAASPEFTEFGPRIRLPDRSIAILYRRVRPYQPISS